MKLSLGCIADDYTGASDLANTLTRSGLRTVQTIGVPQAHVKFPDVDAVVVALKSRSIDAATAVSRSREAEQWLRQHGADHVMFKICSTFDSTDAGNIGPVMDALREDSGDVIVLVTPAFPQTGRTVYMGMLFVGTQPLNESPMKDHPLNPMRDANLVRVLGRQSAAPVGLLDLAAISKGAPMARVIMDGLVRTGARAAIADAVVERDLEVIGEIAINHGLSVGASGLGLGLARALVLSGKVTGHVAAASPSRPVGGAAACLAGSCSQATLQQVTRAAQTMPVLQLDTRKLFAGPAEVNRAIGWAREHLAAGPVLIASSATPDDVATIQAEHGCEAAGHAIEQAMADIAEGIVSAGVRRLVVAGGETSGAVVDRLGIPGFMVGPEIAPGVPVMNTVGARQGDMKLALKSGNFGGADFFSDALKLMN